MATTNSFFVTAALVAAVTYIVISRFQIYLRLRSFPGPFLAKFSKLWLVQGALSGKMNDEFGTICERYGPVVRISGNDLMTDDPEIFWRISAVRSGYGRGDFYAGARLDPKHDNILSTMDEGRHQGMRAKMAAGYAGKENPTLEPSIDAHLSAFLTLISTKYTSTPSSYRPMDFARKAQYLTLDIISEIAFGEAFGDVKEDRDVHEYIAMVEEKVGGMLWVSVFPGLLEVLKWDWLARLVMPSDKDEVGMGKVMGVAKRVVAEHFKTPKEDMLGSFIRKGLTQKEAETESLLQIIAGSDTTAIALRATMLYVLTSPPTYSRLRAEIDFHRSMTTDPRPSETTIISDASARTLPYLTACIREALRMHPPIPAFLPKKVPPGGDMIHGVFVPGGTGIGYCAIGIQRRKDVFGPDAHVFRPERWLEAKGEPLARMEKTADLVFGSGKFGCLGRGVAWLELRKIVFELVARYDMALVNPTRPWKSANMGFWLQSEMWMRVEKRQR